MIWVWGRRLEGFRVQGFGLGVSGFRVQVLGFRV